MFDCSRSSYGTVFYLFFKYLTTLCTGTPVSASRPWCSIVSVHFIKNKQTILNWYGASIQNNQSILTWYGGINDGYPRAKRKWSTRLNDMTSPTVLVFATVSADWKRRGLDTSNKQPVQIKPQYKTERQEAWIQATDNQCKSNCNIRLKDKRPGYKQQTTSANQTAI